MDNEWCKGKIKVVNYDSQLATKIFQKLTHEEMMFKAEHRTN